MAETKRPGSQRPAGEGHGSTRSGGAVVAVVVAVLVVVVGLVLAQTMGGDEEPASAPASAASAGTGSGHAPAARGCDAPPAPPGSPKQYDQAPDPSTAENTTWTGHVMTNCGEITVELYGKQAPKTVASFLFLARDGYWDDSACHRLVTTGIFVLQCGDPTGTGAGDPGYGYGVENAPQDYLYPRGTLAMARTSDPNSNGGQFFIVYKKTELPDPTGYSIFGRVVDGMEIVDRIAKAGNAADGVAPKEPISILDVTVEKAG
jgi:peptidyl-prolyl cis-trans isomerase B (cyclophilin B)